MKYLNTKTLFLSLFLNNIFLYGDTLSTTIDLLQDDKKIESLNNYGVVTIGIEEFNVKPMYKKIDIKRGLAKKLNIQLFGYSLYTKTLSNYKDIQLITPSFNKESIGSEEISQRLSFQYKTLEYVGEQRGNIELYTLQLRADSSNKDKGYGGLEVNYVTMNDDDIENFSKYYSFGIRLEYAHMQGKLITKLSKGEKIPYGFDYGLFENTGCFVGYAWGSGENSEALFEGRYSFEEEGETNNPEETKKHGVVYDFSYGPSIFFTFPIGYLQLQYYGTYSPLRDSFTTNGFKVNLTAIF